MIETSRVIHLASLHMRVCLTRTDKELPFIFVGDDAFNMQPRVTRPYPGGHLQGKQVVLNYRPFCGRRTTKIAFGILSTRLRVVRRQIIAKTSGLPVPFHNCLQMVDHYQPTSYGHYFPLDLDGPFSNWWHHEETAIYGLMGL